MPAQRKPHVSWGGTALDRRRVLLGLAAVGGFLAVDIDAVLYTGGWVGSGGRLTPRVFIDGFEWVNGKQLGFRKNHGKGVAVAGYFDSNGNGPGGIESDRIPAWPDARAGQVLPGGRQPCRGGHGRNGPGSRVGVRLPQRRAVANGDAQSSCIS